MNKPSFTNIVCIAVDLGTSVAVVEALFARNADVQTLDDWQWAAYGRELWADRFMGDPELEATITLSDEFGSEEEFTGLKLDEARAKAAAWVREQAKGAPTHEPSI